MSKERLDQHALISLIKDLAIELGRTPTLDEFKQHKGVTRHAISHAGNYTTLVIAAGLVPVQQKRPAITNAVFETSLERHLEDYKPIENKPQAPYQRTLIVPDIHFPFSHQKTLEKIYRFAEKEKPEIIVQIGDLYDCYSHSKFPKSLNVYTPREETNLSRKMAEEMWRELKKASPNAKCHQMRGNHDDRALKRILEVYPVAEDWIEKIVQELMTFDGVETAFSSRDELMIAGDVAVIHGYKSQLGQHRDAFLHNVVTGHLHVGGVSFRQIHGRVLWELNVGLAGDPQSKGLSYLPTKTTNWTLGWGFIDSYGPRFIPA